MGSEIETFFIAIILLLSVSSSITLSISKNESDEDTFFDVLNIKGQSIVMH